MGTGPRAGWVLAGVLAWPTNGARSYCSDEIALAPGRAFVALQPLLPDVIGEPIECEHLADNGDLLQQTSAGLAFLQAANEQLRHQRQRALGHSLTASLPTKRSPNPSQSRRRRLSPSHSSSPTSTWATPAGAGYYHAQLDVGRFNEAASGPYLYWARRRCTYGIQAFERGANNASAVVSWAANIDEPLDKPGLLPGWACPGRAWPPATMARPVALALVGPLTVRWTAYTDRLVQDVMVPSRPAGIDSLNN